MSRVFITGSTTGLGLAAGQMLMAAGHEVILHARSSERARALASVAPRAAGVVIGDLADMAQTRAVAEQVNRLGRMDAVIHNAGVYGGPERDPTPAGHPPTLAVNVIAPYLLCALMARPDRLVFLSSSMHRGVRPALDDVDWIRRPWHPDRAYAESKLLLTALAFSLARRWPAIQVNAVDPGWVPTRMGGPQATDDLAQGHQTQAWLAVSDAPAAMVSGVYWFHQAPQPPAPHALDHGFQDQLMSTLATLTGIAL